jgi:hypothetical protein
MGRANTLSARKEALRRAREHSPFLREALLAMPEIG